MACRLVAACCSGMQHTYGRGIIYGMFYGMSSCEQVGRQESSFVNAVPDWFLCKYVFFLPVINPAQFTRQNPKHTQSKEVGVPEITPYLRFKAPVPLLPVFDKQLSKQFEIMQINPLGLGYAGTPHSLSIVQCFVNNFRQAFQ